MIAFLNKLRRADRGVTVVETALAMPLVLTLGLGGLETARYVQAVLRANQIAYAVADNAGRVRHALDEADINEIMVGAKLMGGSDFSGNSRIVLSDLEQRTNTNGSGGKGPVTAANPNGYRQWIRWQRCIGALSKASSYGLPRDTSGNAVVNLDSTINVDHGAVEDASTIDGMGPTGQQIAASGGTAVMVVEVFYTYTPLVPFYSYATTSNPVIHVEQAFNIRQRTDFSIYNANKASGTGRSDCRTFNAAVPVV